MNPTNPQFPFCPPFVILSAAPFVILSAAEGSHRPQSSISPHRPNRPQSPISPHRPQKNSVFLREFPSVLLRVLLFVFFTLSSCQNSSDLPPSSTILVTVTGECTCDLFLYHPDGHCLQFAPYDCNESNHVIFTTYQPGPLILKAIHKERVIALTITPIPHHTTEAGIIL